MAEVNFDLSFHRVAAYLESKLRAFTSSEQCGRWNEAICADIQSNEEFRIDFSTLHERATCLAFQGNSPSTDGLGIVRVEIDLLVSVSVVSRLWYFVDCNGQLGYSVAPSRFTVRRSLPYSTKYAASFGLGLCDDHGCFWYPRTNKDCGSLDDPPTSDAEWAFFRSHAYGESLADWARRRKRSGK